MIVAAILGIALSPLWAQAPQASSQNLSQLYDGFVSSTDGSEQMQLLDQIAQTKPVSTGDLADLFDLFVRYSKAPRDAAVASLSRIGPSDYAFAPMLLNYLTQTEPKARFFAILAELRLRDPKALPIIKSIAEPKFSSKSAENSPFEIQQDAWWTQYEALEALAAWQETSAFPLIRKQALLAPDVARILAAHFWVQALPLLVRWANSSKQNMKDAAHEGLSAQAPISDLTPTRQAMLDLVLDSKQPEDVRHYLAIKVGLCSDDSQVAALIQKRQSVSDAQTKLYLLGAIYASRSSQAIPLLQNDAKTNPDPAARRGALIELAEIMKPADYRTLALWVSQNDADASLRSFAQDSIVASSSTTVAPAGAPASH